MLYDLCTPIRQEGLYGDRIEVPTLTEAPPPGGAFPFMFVRSTASERKAWSMPDYDAGDVVRCFARTLFNDNDVQGNVYHWQVDGAATGGSDADFMDGAADWLEDVHAAHQSVGANNITFEDLTFYNITQDRPMGVIAWPTFTAGSSTGEVLPQGIALLVVMYTAVKRVIGKKYYGGLPQGALNDEVWESVTVSGFETAAANLLTPFTAGGTDSVIHGIYRRTLGAFVGLQSVVVRRIPAYQRRRKPGVGI